MAWLKFNDGISFNLDGPVRVECRVDGFYVVGGGMLCPVETVEEAQELIGELENATESIVTDGPI